MALSPALAPAPTTSAFARRVALYEMAVRGDEPCGIEHCTSTSADLARMAIGYRADGARVEAVLSAAGVSL